MVLGMNANNRRSAILQADYIINVKENKPWPPSQSLNSLRSVMIQWENGTQSSGSTNLVVPSIGSVVGEGKIEFNQSFNLSVAFPRVMSIRSSSFKAFQKNCLEFNLYEPRRDKVKGQLLGTAVVDLAEYGILKESLSVSAVLNCKRNFRNISQPVLFIDIQPVNNSLKNSPSRNSLAREMSMDRSGDSVLALMSEEYAEEAAGPSVTDDDGSSHSSLTVASSAYESNEDLIYPTEESSLGSMKDSTSVGFSGLPTTQIAGVEKSSVPVRFQYDSGKAFSSCTSGLEISSVAVSPVKVDTSFSNLSETTSRPVSTVENDIIHSLQSTAVYKFSNEHIGNENANGNLIDKPQGKIIKFQDISKIDSSVQQGTILNTSNHCSTFMRTSFQNGSSFDKNSDIGEVDDEEALSRRTSVTTLEEAADKDNIIECLSVKKVEDRHLNGEDEKHIQEKDVENLKREQIRDITENFSEEQVSRESEAHSINKDHLEMGITTTYRQKHVKSVRSLSISSIKDISDRCYHFPQEAKEAVSTGTRTLLSGEKKGLKFHSRGSSTVTDSRVQKLEQRIKILEGELREAAAIEVALYSVVAEHGSSTNKVHAPARRLSRLYLHACEEKSQASAAKTSVSGLVLVTKACGNDVPRLTYWLSNCVVLRTIISLATGHQELPLSTGLDFEGEDDKTTESDRSSSLNWKEINQMKDADFINVSDWGDPQTYTRALEKVEGWIFSRIIESLWWQTLVPYMQCFKESFNNRISYSRTEHKRTADSDDQVLSSFSVELWNEAFKDASERLCPVRAESHDCGCLPVLSRLVMEQCAVRLDVAMFNAIVRESADEVPTDPVSDPIGDPRVLPIPVGKSSFGAGAQLKNAIGNWSMRLSELFGCKLSENEREQNDEDDRQDATTNYFYLLNTLSDLMMLPKDMLLINAVRKEVCPILGAQLIKRLLNFHIPDEFCPDLVPVAVLEALDCEVSNEFNEECISHVPCVASPPVYHPPSADSLAHIVGKSGNPELRNSTSSLLRKSHTSDDELEELRSPLSLIPMDGICSSAKSMQRPKEEASTLRYKLLREVWQNSA
ncbi:unnamed protein product [Rhodiola kirilowii]